MIPDLTSFFADYERAFNAFDVDTILTLYAQWSMAAGPQGNACAQNDSTLRTILAQSYEFYKTLYRRNGIAGTRIAALRQTPIDDCHAMATVTWAMMRPDGSQVLTFDVTYIVQQVGGALTIILFIAPDEMAILHEKGLL